MAAVLVVMKEARTRSVGIQELIAEFGKQARVNYELLVEAASDAIIAVDRMGRILTWNQVAEKMFGFSRKEAIGSPYFNILSGTENTASFHKESDAGGAERPTITIELKGKRKGGEEFPVEITLAAKNVANGWLPTTATLIIRDITERKKAEETLRDAASHYSTVADNTYDFEFWTN